jgi:hypothetical protein
MSALVVVLLIIIENLTLTFFYYSDRSINNISPFIAITLGLGTLYICAVAYGIVNKSYPFWSRVQLA